LLLETWFEGTETGSILARRLSS